MVNICVVGSCDVPNQPRWRNPEDADFVDPSAVLPDWLSKSWEGPCNHRPSLHRPHFDITRGLPRGIESQLQRHWVFVPALWNLYARQRVNLGISLSVKNRQLSLGTDNDKEQDAAMEARDQFEEFKLEPKLK